MTGSWPPVDSDALLAELREALIGAGPTPDEFLATARAAFTWRRVDVELALAELIFDSACDAAPAGPIRATGLTAGGPVRTLTFRSAASVLEFEVSGAGVVGQLTPASGGRLTAATPHGPYEEVPIDPAGYFSLGVPPAGPVRLTARTGGHTIATDWVCLR